MNVKSLINTVLICFLVFLCRAAYAGIHDAAATGNVEQLKKHLADDPELISARNGPTRTPLCIAAMCGQTKAVAFLIAQGADVNDRGFRGLPPLAEMAANGITTDQRCAEIAAMLLAHGAEVDLVDAYDTTPLLYAVQFRKSRLARVLLEHGARLTRMYNGSNSGMMPLQMAIRNGDKETVGVLLEFKAPFDSQDREGAALRFAEARKETEIVAMIRKADAQAAQAPPPTYSTPPTLEEMRTLAKRIADGYDMAFDELALTTKNLYGEIKDYRKENARVMVLLVRMKAAFDVLGDEAGKGNAKALQALQKCLGQDSHLQAFAPDALGIAAAKGNKEALDILLGYKNWNILESSAIFSLALPAKANVEPAVDCLVTWLAELDPENRNGGMALSTIEALTSAANKGSQRAKEALEKFAVLSKPNN